jgi:hypothetical protein
VQFRRRESWLKRCCDYDFVAGSLWCIKTKRNDGRLNQHCLIFALQSCWANVDLQIVADDISFFARQRKEDAECDAMRMWPINEIDDGSSFIQTTKKRSGIRWKTTANAPSFDDEPVSSSYGFESCDSVQGVPCPLNSAAKMMMFSWSTTLTSIIRQAVTNGFRSF